MSFVADDKEAQNSIYQSVRTAGFTGATLPVAWIFKNAAEYITQGPGYRISDTKTGLEVGVTAPAATGVTAWNSFRGIKANLKFANLS